MDINIDIPFRLNFNNLDGDTQKKLMEQSKKEVALKFGSEMKAYAQENHLDYQEILEEEAIKNLYNYKFMFTI
ncbi:hypothetical protein FEE95_14285 [Maribacter algarum]|uniref:Uncharacterized protein n=1 Tax=Maribacter algarum (ex Zhang et al. 2020) TaxID=2578118 RepID=A0A5S3PT12_9FLAO|nr:hypothetical protein [Maribacter algarum]TMM55820.1 hypothetical protein FEE95_14285 [Maribacter algarum]